MFRLLFTCIGICVCMLTVQAQTFTKPSVPDVIDFAGMKLELTPAAKRKVEADVTMIYSSGKFLQQKIDRANLYFPIIERVFHEEGFPEEFKYLALQESSLVSDAVSSSNAVGFWQFKKETAIEVGVNVNANVDERMHIAYASRGAAKYLKKNNLLLDNWIYALLSYNVGPGGVKMHVKSKYVGATHMLIDDDMHWYVIRFLAYKTAYEDLIGKANHPDLTLIEYSGIKNKSLTEISKQSKVEYELLKEYNKWCTKGTVPDDKEYIVIIPAAHGTKPDIDDKNPEPVVIIPTTKDSAPHASIPKTFPDISTYTDSSLIPIFVSINKVKAIRASRGDDINSLLVKAGLSRQSFLFFNEMKGFESVSVGSFYYLQLKRNKALVAFHTVAKGETLFSIAQKYAITTASIRKHNRLAKNEFIKENRVLWLRDTRPKNTPVEYKVPPVVVKDKPKPVKESLEPVQNTEMPLTKPKQAATFDSASAIYHVVQTGETVFGISRQYAVDSDSIRTWNHLTGYAILLNQKLIVGYKIKKQNSKIVYHTVQAGETAYKISKQYNVSVDEIKQWNNLPDYNLKPGQELKIVLP